MVEFNITPIVSLYLRTVEPTTSFLFDAINIQENTLEAIERKWEGKSLVVDAQNVRVLSIISSAFQDFESTTDADQLREKIYDYKQYYKIIESTLDPLYSALLQYAKQALSYSGIKQESEVGRRLGQSDPKCVPFIVYGARNQALHWEEKEPMRKGTKDCFVWLACNYDEDFSPAALSKRRGSRARKVCREVLRWTNSQAMKQDIDLCVRESVQT